MNNRIFPIVTESDKKLPYYLLGVGCDWEQEHVVSKDGYFYQWIQCVEGEGELITSGKTFRIKRGSAMLLLKDISHEYYAISPSWKVEWLLFDGEQVEYFLKTVIGIKTSTALYVSRPDIFISKIRSIMEIEESESGLKNIKCSSIIYSLLTDIMQYVSVNPDNSALNQHYKLKPLFDYIELNYKQTLTLEDMANVIGITRQHLCTLFKKITGIRIFQYINSVRIKKSKELLLQKPHLKIKEISHLAGFEDVSYYCSVFKKHEKMSPGQFKKIHNLE